MKSHITTNFVTCRRKTSSSMSFLCLDGLKIHTLRQENFLYVFLTWRVKLLPLLGAVYLLSKAFHLMPHQCSMTTGYYFFFMKDRFTSW